MGQWVSGHLRVRVRVSVELGLSGPVRPVRVRVEFSGGEVSGRWVALALAMALGMPLGMPLGMGAVNEFEKASS